MTLNSLGEVTAAEKEQRAERLARLDKFLAQTEKARERVNWGKVTRQLEREIARALKTSPDNVSVTVLDGSQPEQSMLAQVHIEGIAVPLRVQPQSDFSSVTTFWLTYEPLDQCPLGVDLYLRHGSWPRSTSALWKTVSFHADVLREVVEDALVRSNIEAIYQEPETDRPALSGVDEHPEIPTLKPDEPEIDLH